MSPNQGTLKALDGLSEVVGQVSLWLGGLIALAWTVGFAVLARHVMTFQAAGPDLVLPIEPPLIALAIGLLGVCLARLGDRSAPIATMIGLVLSAEALALAAVVRLGWLG